VGCQRLFERELAVEQRKKSSSSSPASRVQGKKKTWVPFKTALFQASFFFVTVHETTSFFPKRAVLFKWILEPKRVRFKIKPSICVRFAFWSLVSDFFN
jgi:hypothetical protein